MKFSPLRTVPAGTLETTLAACLLCFVSMGRSSFPLFGDGVRGVLKGCAADVDVAAGLTFGRPWDAVVSCAETACALMIALLAKFRLLTDCEPRPASRRMHWRQIIVVGVLNMLVAWMRGCVTRRCCGVRSFTRQMPRYESFPREIHVSK